MFVSWSSPFTFTMILTFANSIKSSKQASKQKEKEGKTAYRITVFNSTDRSLQAVDMVEESSSVREIKTNGQFVP